MTIAARSASTSPGRTPRSGRRRITPRACASEGPCAGWIADREMGPGERRAATRRRAPGTRPSAPVAGSSAWARSRRAPAMSPRWMATLIRAARAGRGRDVPLEVRREPRSRRSPRRTRRRRPSRRRSMASRARCPSRQWQSPVLPVRAAAATASARAASAPSRSPFVRRASASSQRAKSRQGLPAASSSTARVGVRQRVVRAQTDHRSPQHRSPGFERGGAVGRPTLEGPALGDVRQTRRRGDVPDRQLLPGRQDGEPRALPERIVTETPEPGAVRRAATGPVIAEHGPAHERSRRGRGHRPRTRGRPRGRCAPFASYQAAARRCSSVTRPGSRVASSPWRKSRSRVWYRYDPPYSSMRRVDRARPARTLGRPRPARDDIADGSGEPLEDRGAGQEADLRLGAVARAARIAGTRR